MRRVLILTAAVVLSLLSILIITQQLAEQPQIEQLQAEERQVEQEWRPIPFEPPEVPDEIMEVTIEEIRQADDELFIMLTAAETIRVTGVLYSYDVWNGHPAGITLIGETGVGEGRLWITDAYGISLWRTCPDGTDHRLVRRGFEEKVEIGQMLMVEGNLHTLNHLHTTIDKIYIRE